MSKDREQISFALTRMQKVKVDCPKLPYYQFIIIITIKTTNKYSLNIYYVLGTALGSLNAITHLINQIKFYISNPKEKVIDTIKL